MAGLWIKVEHATPDKPEIDRLAHILGIDHDAAFGKCVRFWIWADQQSVNGDALGVTESFLDRLTNCPGFAAGLLKVGWLMSRNGRLSVPHFDRQNGQTAKARALTKDRMKRSRDAPSVTKSSPDREKSKRRNESSLEDSSPCMSPKGDVHFLKWWEKYPKKVGKDKARAAWIKAGKRIRRDRNCGSADAVAHMLAAVEAFAITPKALGPYCPNPATWLNGGNYDDDRAIWNLSQDSSTVAAERHSVDLATLDLDAP